MQQSLGLVIPSAEYDAPIKATPEPDLENPLVMETVDKANEEDQVSPERSSSLVSVEVSVGTHASSVSDGMLTSPSNYSRRTLKRKKPKGSWSFKKKQAIEKKLQTLSERLNLVPFVPSKALDFAKHEMMLKSLGLWDFVSIGLGSDFNNIRSDLVAQLIATYDPKSRASYVNDVRIKVNRADLARAFKLPLKKEKTSNLVAITAVDLDLTAVSESCMAFLENFVSNWIILNNDEELWIMPEEVVNLTKPIKDGHPDKMDWSTLLWFMVEQELMLGEHLMNCNYASHLQYLIRSQREELLSIEPDEGVMRQETETILHERDTDKLTLMEEPKIGETCEEEVLEKKDDGDEEEAVKVKGQDKEEMVLEKKDDNEVMDVKGNDTDEKKDDDGGDGDELLEKDQDEEEDVLETENGVNKEDVLETEAGVKEELPEKKDDNSEEDVTEKKDDDDLEKVLKDSQRKNEEVLETNDYIEKEEVAGKKDNGDEGANKVDEVVEVGEEGNNVKGGLSIELTLGQELTIEEVSKDVEIVDFEEFKYDHVEEQDQQQWLLNGKNIIGAHFLQRCSTRDNTVSSDYIAENNEEVDDMNDEGVDGEHGFDVNELEGEGLDVNFLEAMAAAKLTYNSQPSVDIMDSQNDLIASGPSFYDNNGKRKIDHDVYDNKRLRLEEGSSDHHHQAGDFMTLMEEIQLLTDRVKNIYKEKVDDQQHSNMNQQILINELQKRDAMIEHLHQIKQEEIEKRDLQIDRLNRELFLMCSLLDEYKKALNQTDRAFDEYRQKNKLFEEEQMYKDAGYGGIVLSITEIEKRRQKEEEEEIRVKLEIEQKIKEAEESYAFQFEEFLVKVKSLDKKLSVFENEFKSLKDSFSRPNVLACK